MAIDVVIVAAVCKTDKGQEKARREVWNRTLESAAAFRQEVEIVSGVLGERFPSPAPGRRGPHDRRFATEVGQNARHRG
jgi:hypothetical protein